MRNPRLRSNSQRLRTGTVTIPANAALPINGVSSAAAVNQLGVKFGSVVVCSVLSANGQQPGIIITACCPADGVVLVDLTNAYGVIYNQAETVVRWMVLPQ